MEKEYDIVAMGELLIDFTPAGVSETGMCLYERNPGGAPVNMLTAAAKAGLRTAFIGKVGNDMHGKFLIEAVENQNINSDGIILDDNVFTTLAFVNLTKDGERSFAFARKPGADTMIGYKEVDTQILQNTKVFHVGSLSLTDEPARSTTFQAVKCAKNAGAVISYDPNYRAPLWNNEKTAIERMRSMLPFADGATNGTADDGIDDNDTTVISKAKAYELASKELLAANQIGDTEGIASVGVGTPDTAVDLTNGTGTFEIKLGQAKVANALSFSLHVGADADMTNKIQVDIESMSAAGLGIKGLNVKDDSGKAATYAIDAIADAVSKVSSQRSALGAVQNRLEHTIANVDNVVENTTSAESRIRDTDMASEMVNYSKNNILAQAGQSMLAQANQSNQGVLSLLQ